MPSQTRSPTLWADQGGPNTWTGNASALGASDDDRVTATGGATLNASIRTTNFGFAIPAGAAIEGFELHLEKSSLLGSAIDIGVSLRTDTATSAGQPDATPWPTSDSGFSYGGPTDLWGFAVTPTPAEVNHANFGAFVNAFSATPLETARLDHVEIVVYYSGGGSTFENFRAFSSWVWEVAWVPTKGVQVTFHHLGVPYFACYYPNTTFDDYQRFLLAPSLGKHVHQRYLRRPYIPVPIGNKV